MSQRAARIVSRRILVAVIATLAANFALMLAAGDRVASDHLVVVGDPNAPGMAEVERQLFDAVRPGDRFGAISTGDVVFNIVAGAIAIIWAVTGSLIVDLTPNGIGRYDQDVEAAVYFCCLEALQNVAKYAGASRATVAFAHDDGRLSFRVSDDGVGFDPSRATAGLGLQGMADRVEAIGGSFVIRSAPGEGTTITGTIPVR